MAEEKAAELDNKVRIGAVLRARDIALLALNANSREVSRIKNAARLRVDFTISANELAALGDKTVYVRITSPDGYVLTTEQMPTFEFEGERLSYSAQRTVQYDNTQDLDVGIFYASTGFTAGTYKVQRSSLRGAPDRPGRHRHAVVGPPQRHPATKEPGEATLRPASLYGPGREARKKSGRKV